jgi:hypothetical protein
LQNKKNILERANIPLSRPDPIVFCSLVYVVDGQRAVGYDNERGKGDHRHLGTDEMPYRFIDIDQMVEDFLKDVEGFMRRNYEG